LSTHVLVVGGGLAGISAALRCADAGARVTLLEQRPRLGGLTHSFERDGPGGRHGVDNGQHVFLRCCTAYRSLLERLGVAHLVVLQPRLDILVLSPGARPARLRRAPLPAPLHLAPALARYALLSPAERVGAARAALALGRVDPGDPRTDERSFGAWLAEHRQGPRAVAALWDLVGVATLNAGADDVSLAAAATVFQQGLLTRAGAGDIGWSTVPLQELHGGPAERALLAAGADVRTGTKAEGVLPPDAASGDRWRVRVRTDHGAGAELLEADRVVVAVPPPAAERLLPAGALPPSAGWAPGWSRRLGSSPIVDVHVRYDRRVLTAPFAAGVGTPVQWVFDRTAPPGRRGDGGQDLVVSLSAAHDLLRTPSAQVQDRVLPALAELLPAARSAQVLDAFVTREPHATFLAAPGTAALRPPAATALAGLAVAGSWTATGWPATMEGAVRSGESAALAVLGGTASTGTQTPSQEVAA
jgi:hydroxysqualene dehydroxylase